MTLDVRIGNQTAFSAADGLAPFAYALRSGFGAFEWFEDKKTDENGGVHGWAFADVSQSARAALRDFGSRDGMVYTVHAPWQANALLNGGLAPILESIAFARDIDAALANIHLYAEEGPERYVDALAPALRASAEAGILLTLENTPDNGPDEMNAFFDALRARQDLPSDHVGVCFDMGHANVCAATRNDFIAYLDRLGGDVPIRHLHVHENWGDGDTHLPLFTGPARDNDAGLRCLLDRLDARDYSGPMILEQWPEPPELLRQAAERLWSMMDRPAGQPAPEDMIERLLAILRQKAEPEGLDNACGGERDREDAATDAANDGDEAAAVGEAEQDESALAAGNRDERLPPPTDATPEILDPGADAPPLIRRIVAMHKERTSWRLRLDWVRETLAAPDFEPTAEAMATLEVYLRFLATGQAPCAEDGGHHRPCRHAEAAQAIDAALAERVAPEDAWLARRLGRWLPSYDDDYRRSEPLTRIRDIAHRNDIPQDLKREIKTRLQNKLHRSAGPEDLFTAEEILARVTVPGADVSESFVREFKIFCRELRDFFNAPGLDARLAKLAPLLSAKGEAAATELRTAMKAECGGARERLDKATALRRQLALEEANASATTRQQIRLADGEAESYAFALLAEILGGTGSSADDWPRLLPLFPAAVEHVGLARLEAEECGCIVSEATAWLVDFDDANRFHLLRLKASLERARRVAETVLDRLTSLYPPVVECLGAALGVERRALDVFCESDVRGHVVFQLSRVVDALLRGIRQALDLPPWSAVVPGEAEGELVAAESLQDLQNREAPCIVLLKHADGDEESPPAVRGIVLAHDLPHLSHLGVRARQARIPFAAGDDPAAFSELGPGDGRHVRLAVSAEGMTMETCEASAIADATKPASPAIEIPPVEMREDCALVPVAEATRATCGAKAEGAGMLRCLAESAGGLFQAPDGVAIPFGAMEACLANDEARRERYETLMGELGRTPPAAWDDLLVEMREIIETLAVPESLVDGIRQAFDASAFLAVRSSANGEDLEAMAGAGLYDSVVGVRPGDAGEAIKAVWASLWTRRAALSRHAAGIPHDRIRMAVLVQTMVDADLSFVMHTTDPVTGDAGTASVELAAGLGETLASACEPGTPYRLHCARNGDTSALTACASFSHALRPDGRGGVSRERLEYSQVPLSADRNRAPALGTRLARVADHLESHFGAPQDAEGAFAGEALVLVQSRHQQGLDAAEAQT